MQADTFLEARFKSAIQATFHVITQEPADDQCRFVTAQREMGEVVQPDAPVSV